MEKTQFFIIFPKITKIKI